MTRLSGWGRYPWAESELLRPSTLARAQQFAGAAQGAAPRGAGRAYGDAAIGERQTIAMGLLDRVRAFDPASGRVTVETGMLLGDLIATFLPRGFFPAVVPGTRTVTVGGAIAADVHGKNHHRDGGFGDHVERLVLALPQGEAVVVSRESRPELFHATVGGMGLTGAILEATLRLRPVETGWIRQRTVVAPDLAGALSALAAADASTYSVAWIDSLARGSGLGRSLIFIGEHAVADDLADGQDRFPPPRRARLAVPFDLPDLVLNRWSMGAFNQAYFGLGASGGGHARLVEADRYFFPLDAVGGWNRIYGSRGFVQHQCVLPLATAERALAEILERVARRGESSFLAVLKKLGPASGLISFPMPGFTLALDFPVRGDVLAFLDQIDQVVVGAGGRLYLAKDARQSRETFEAGYPGLERFRDVRRAIDPSRRFQSRLATRIGL